MERILDDTNQRNKSISEKNFSCMDNIQAITQLTERSR